MRDLLLVVPSRERPHNAQRLRSAWHATTEGRSDLAFLVDDDDPTKGDYPESLTIIGEPGRLVGLTNRCAVANVDRYRAFASWGDDHVPLDAFEGPIMGAIDEAGGVAIVGTNDGVHGAAIPTACVVTANIVVELGWMALPTLEHLCCDLAWKALGVAADCWRYLPNVHVEHRHPIVGRASWDATYERGNSGVVSARDHEAYEAWLADGLEADAARVRTLRASVASPGGAVR